MTFFIIFKVRRTKKQTYIWRHVTWHVQVTLYKYFLNSTYERSRNGFVDRWSSKQTWRSKWNFLTVFSGSWNSRNENFTFKLSLERSRSRFPLQKFIRFRFLGLLKKPSVLMCAAASQAYPQCLKFQLNSCLLHFPFLKQFWRNLVDK